jgi:hypothetical protein
MDYLQNHIWCSDSNWGGMYSCRHWVHFTNTREYEVNDWSLIINDYIDSFINQYEYNVFKKRYQTHDDEELIERCTHLAPNLKPHVFEWLEANIKDRPAKNTGDSESLKGWCIGSANYRGKDPYSFTVFFYRKRDAMAFIREFSVYKKPVHYCQYFSDVRKVLDLKTGKYTVV